MLVAAAKLPYTVLRAPDSFRFVFARVSFCSPPRRSRCIFQGIPGCRRSLGSAFFFIAQQRYFYAAAALTVPYYLSFPSAALLVALISRFG